MGITTSTRRSRFAPKSTGAAVVITKNDLRILELLQRYRYLPSTYIAALLGVSYAYLKGRLTILRHEARVIDCPASSWHAANARYRPAVYCLTDAGEQALKKHGIYRTIIRTSEPFEHEFGVCLTAASFEIGIAANPELVLITSDEILAHRACPSKTSNSKTPFQIPVSFTYTAPSGARTPVTADIKHDWHPFGIGYKRPDGKISRLFFPGMEFDRRTEPLEPERYERSSIRKHFEAILELSKTDGYGAHYGIPNSIVPFVTINEFHMHAMMALLKKMTGGKGSKKIIFKSVADFSSFEKFPQPTGHMLTQPWLRVGHDPYDILKELGATGESHAGRQDKPREGADREAGGD